MQIFQFRKRLVQCIVVVFLLSIGCMSVAAGSEYPIRERIMYGGRPFTPEMIKADNEFFKYIDGTGRTREEASDRAFELGAAELDNGKLDKAIRRFNQVWLLNPDNYKAYWGFAIILDMRDKDLDSAKAMFDKAVLLNPHDENLLFNYALFYERQGESEEAIALYKKGLALVPDAFTGYNQIIRIYVRADDYENAKKWLLRGDAAGAFCTDYMQLHQYILEK